MRQSEVQNGVDQCETIFGIFTFWRRCTLGALFLSYSSFLSFFKRASAIVY